MAFSHEHQTINPRGKFLGRHLLAANIQNDQVSPLWDLRRQSFALAAKNFILFRGRRSILHAFFDDLDRTQIGIGAETFFILCNTVA